jgi:AAA+ superfamily predicted ATPase
MATARTPRTQQADEHAAELRAVAARARLRMYAYIGWNEQAAGGEGWRDRWEDAASRERWRAESERGRELASSIATIEASLRAGRASTRIAQLFGLRPAELDILHGCLALALDPDLAGAVAAISGRAVPSEPMLRAIFDLGPARIMTPDSRLARWELVRTVELAPGEPEGLVVDPAIADWFTGAYAVEAELVSLGRAVRVRDPLAGWPVDELAAELDARVREGAGTTRVVVVGPPGSGRRSFAAAVAARLGLRLFTIDADLADDAGWPTVVRRAHRQAYLSEAAFAIVGEAQHRRCAPLVVGACPVAFAIVEHRPVMAQAGDLIVELPPPAVDDRTRLWKAGLPAWPDDQIGELARTYRAMPGDIAHVVARAPATLAAAGAVVRERTRGLLGELAQRLECPFGWDDLVLPAATHELLRDFAFEAGERAHVWSDPAIGRLFPQGRGLIALWTGAPGTGKTMAAQTIAAELGLDLFRISLSEVVSKYVGETAKNMQRVLSRAERMDAVLFFDEADALFGKRVEIRDAHDRYANTDTDHLLQAIEAFSGIAILASNKKTNCDPAFMRRLRYVVEFARPDAAQRRILWSRLVEAVCGAEAARANTAVLDAAASVLELTGAQIKLSVLAALFAARRDRAPVAARHLVRGIERELLKEGRSLSDREKERLRG